MLLSGASVEGAEILAKQLKSLYLVMKLDLDAVLIRLDTRDSGKLLRWKLLSRNHLDRRQQAAVYDLGIVGAVRKRYCRELLEHPFLRNLQFTLQPISAFLDFCLNLKFFQVLQTYGIGSFFAISRADSRLRGVQVNQVFVDKSPLLWR